MKKYYVNVHYDVVITVEVFANNEDEAIDKAFQDSEYIDIADGEVVDSNACVVHAEKISE